MRSSFTKKVCRVTISGAALIGISAAGVLAVAPAHAVATPVSAVQFASDAQPFANGVIPDTLGSAKPGGTTKKLTIYDTTQRANGVMTLVAPTGTTFKSVTNNIGASVTLSADKTTATTSSTTFGGPGASVYAEIIVPSTATPGQQLIGSATVKDSDGVKQTAGAIKVTVEGTIPSASGTAAPGATTGNIKLYDPTQVTVGTMTVVAPTGTTFQAVTNNISATVTLSDDKKSATMTTSFGVGSATVNARVIVPSTAKPGSTISGGTATVKNAAGIVVTSGAFSVNVADKPAVLTAPLPGAAITPSTTFSGTGAVGDVVVVTDSKGNAVGNAIVDANGNWSLSLKPAPENGTTNLTFVSSGNGGNLTPVAQGDYTMTLSEEVRALTSPEAGATITPDTTFAGTGHVGDTVVIKDKNGNVLGETTVGTDGTWSTTLNPAPNNGDTNLIIEVTGKDGETETIADNTYEMTDSATGFQLLSPDLSKDDGSVKDGTVFTGKAEPGTTVVLTNQDGTVLGEATADVNGDWSTPVTGLPQGPSILTATHTAPGADPVVTDLGQVVVVSDDEATPLMDPAIAGGTALTLLAAAGAFLTIRRRTA